MTATELLIVAGSGHVEGDVKARTVQIEGLVIGDIHAENVNISAGTVRGDIYYTRLDINNGTVTGGMQQNGDSDYDKDADETDDIEVND